MNETVNIIGLGYIGLPTALAFAQAGVDVVGTDIDTEKITKLTHGEVTFEEQGLEELFRRAHAHIHFTDKPVPAEIYIVTAGTPYIKETKKVDLRAVLSATKSVLTTAEDGAILVIESTVSPGSIDEEIRPLLPKDRTIHLVHAPERIIPGNMVYELFHNARTVGADDPAIAERVRDLYARFCKGEISITDIRTAEMTKVVENTFRDINIAFANELAKICRKGGMDVSEVIRIANKHPRVSILSPGPGVGGHCISVDPWFLVGEFPDETPLIRTAREVNSSMPVFVLGRALEIAKKHGIAPERIGLYGLSYKENVDDTRESPTLQLLEKSPFAHPVYDPHVKKAVVPNQCMDAETFLQSADLIVVMVAHDALRELDLTGKVVLDTKRVLEGAYTL